MNTATDGAALPPVSYTHLCHADTKVKDDPATPTHAALIRDKRWDTCLGCHDFHGNHHFKPPRDLKDAISPDVIATYLKTGPSPYGERVVKASTPEDSP